jgi:hypothetical protein
MVMLGYPMFGGPCDVSTKKKNTDMTWFLKNCQYTTNLDVITTIPIPTPTPTLAKH